MIARLVNAMKGLWPCLLAPNATIRGHRAGRIGRAIEHYLTCVRASAKVRESARPILIGTVFPIATSDQIMELRGNTQRESRRATAASSRARKVDHQNVGCYRGHALLCLMV